MLMDHCDPEVARSGRTRKDQLMAVELEVAGVGSVDAGEDLHQSALARSVLADERVDLVGDEIEVDVDEGLDGAKSLGDPGQLENGRDLGHLLPTRRTSMPRFLAAFTESAGARSSLMTRLRRSVGQKVAIATRSHFVWSKTPITSLAVTTIALLSSASSALTSVRPSSRVKPTAPTNAFWMFSGRSIVAVGFTLEEGLTDRSEEHTSELQSLTNIVR